MMQSVGLCPSFGRPSSGTYPSKTLLPETRLPRFGKGKHVPNLKRSKLLGWLGRQPDVWVEHKGGKHPDLVHVGHGPDERRMVLPSHNRSDAYPIGIIQELAQLLGIEDWHKLPEFVRNKVVLHAVG